MKDVYMRPEAEVISFAPRKAIALEEPGWGWENEAFSPQEVNTADGVDVYDVGRSGGREG